MSRFTIAPLAELDLLEIWEYISQDSEDAADLFLDRIYAQCGAIAKTQYIGRSRDDEFGSGIRSFPIGQYTIYYSIEDDAVEIHRVLHGARDIHSELDEA